MEVIRQRRHCFSQEPVILTTCRLGQKDQAWRDRHTRKMSGINCWDWEKSGQSQLKGISRISKTWEKLTACFSSAVRVQSPSDPGVKSSGLRVENAECLGLHGRDQCLARL